MPPFSNKKKKQQLQQKRQMKRERADDPSSFYKTIMQKTHFRGKPIGRSQDQKDQNVKGGDGGRSRERFADLQFFKDTDEEIRTRKEQSMLPIIPLEENQLEIDADAPAISLDMPKRPAWNKTFTREQLDRQEQIYFKNFIDEMLHEATLKDKKLSYFDLNLDTWRQLWRVLEMSEIVTIIVDVRQPQFHFPPALYEYIVKDLKRTVIVVLNKIDLVPASLVIAWKSYLKDQYPEVRVIPFASYAGMKTKSNGKRVGNLHMAADGARRYMLEVERLVGPNEIDFSSWKEKIQIDLHEGDEQESDHNDSDEDDQSEIPSKALKEAEQIKAKNDTSYYSGEKYKDGILTIGCVGHPNVGKSSFMNALIGKKVVSVSRTPGHTKHFQTIFLTKNIRLCDCPGLVFPSYYPKQLQVLMGCYPISQLREPYSSIQYLAERVDIVQKLKLKPIDEIRHQRPALKAELDCYSSSAKGSDWSAFSICESWAVMKGFLTAKAGRPDVYRAANHILRMALDGRTLCMSAYPPNYLCQRESHWEQHEDIEEIRKIQGLHNIIIDDGY